AETCDGTSTACPADAFVAAATVCRTSAGACDLAEQCSGASPACPTDAKSTAACRAATDVCDAAESCDGVGDDCPPDVAAPAGTVCRPAGPGCDVAEMCTGTSASCPPDPPNTDGDGDGVPDNCDPCTNLFDVRAVKPKFLMTRLLAPGGDDRLKFKGTIVVPTTPGIDPATRGLRLVVTDGAGITLVDALLGGRARWRSNNNRVWTYRDNTASVAGISKVSLKSRAPGEIKFVIVGRNATYLPPSGSPVQATLVIDPPVATTGQCGEASFADGTEESCQVFAAGAKLVCK
ncbi:MAG: hypothetical protein ACREQL_03270, partial [Candidatus Binatia bacterium]